MSPKKEIADFLYNKALFSMYVFANEIRLYNFLIDKGSKDFFS